MEENVIILAAAIHLATLIVFFVMASNVSKINRKLHGESRKYPGIEYYKLAQEEMYVGNKDKARDYLMRAKYQYEVKKEPYYLSDGSSDNSKIIAKIDKQLFELL